MKAALLAIQALGGNGFRGPAAMPKANRRNLARRPSAAATAARRTRRRCLVRFSDSVA
jgi:hypothetical protein